MLNLVKRAEKYTQTPLKTRASSLVVTISRLKRTTDTTKNTRNKQPTVPKTYARTWLFWICAPLRLICARQRLLPSQTLPQTGNKMRFSICNFAHMRILSAHLLGINSLLCKHSQNRCLPLSQQKLLHLRCENHRIYNEKTHRERWVLFFVDSIRWVWGCRFVLRRRGECLF